MVTTRAGPEERLGHRPDSVKVTNVCDDTAKCVVSGLRGELGLCAAIVADGQRLRMVTPEQNHFVHRSGIRRTATRMAS